MHPVLKDISDQFHVCAALMSDPLLMREQPAMVARQFWTAMSKVEQLRTFLVKPPPKEGVNFEHWMDESIIDAGIKRMVTLVLKQHMTPLVGKMPEIFNRELKGERARFPDENVVVREIKEVNCMAAVVLLYYYLMWYIMLVLLNAKTYPCQRETKAPWGREDELKDFLKGLPQEKQMLEFRSMRVVLGERVPAMPAHLMTNKTLAVDDTNRSTDLVHIYQSLLYRVFDEFQPGDDIRPLWWVYKHNTAENKHTRLHLHYTSQAMCQGISAKSILHDLKLFGNTRSIFNLQDDIQKWENMYTEFEIRSDFLPQDEEILKTIKPREAIFKYRLVDVLKNDPYSVDTATFTTAAIHDYGSATIMMDISRSLIEISDLIYESLKPAGTIEKTMLQFIVRSVHVESRFLEQINENDGRKGNKTNQHKFKFIKDTLNSFRSLQSAHPDVYNAKIAIDQLGGYYWGSKIHDMVNTNHQYVSFYGINKTDGFRSAVNRLQDILCTMDKRLQVVLMTYLQPLLRNSLFVSSFTDTASKLIEKMKCHRLFPDDQHVLTMQASTFGRECNMINPFVETGVPADGYIDPTTPNTTLPFTRQAVLDLINAERAELQRHVASLKEFNKYPGVSWPVYTNAEKTADNSDSFTFVREVVKGYPETKESVYDVAARLDELVTVARNFGGGAVGGGDARAGGAGMDAAEQVRLAVKGAERANEAADRARAEADRATAAAATAAAAAAAAGDGAARV